MPSTFDRIATFTVTSSTTSIDFTSIPATYSDLVIVGQWRDNVNASSLKIRTNGQSSGYRRVFYARQSNTVGGGNDNSASDAYGGEDVTIAGSFNSYYAFINNYTFNNGSKVLVARMGSRSPQQVFITSQLPDSNNAVNRINFFVDNGFGIGTNFTIYGILRA